MLKFTQIDDEVQVFHNDSQDPVWKHGILRHTDEAQTHTLELQGGANKLEVKAFNDIGSASLFGSITYSYADRTETHVWEDNAGHHVPRRPEPFEHYVHEFQH
ncbi:MAG: hypothetical protein HKN44_09385 [Ilumatobacter sp.]|nr:hypothetical protein [Ilumatobacter sp.]